MAWIFLSSLPNGTAGQCQGVCEVQDDLTAAESGPVAAQGRERRLSVGSLALCLETGKAYFMGSDQAWAEVKT